MAFHLAAWYEAQLKGPYQATAYTTPQPLAVVMDMYLYGSGSTGFMLPKDFDIVAAYGCSGYMIQAQIQAPSLLRVGYESIRPIQQNPSGFVTPNDPNLMNLTGSQTMLKSGERVVAAGLTANSATEPGVVLLWLCDGSIPIPAGDAYVLRYTQGSATGTTTVGQWSPLTPVFDQSIPSGRYAITGIDHWSPTGVAVRIACPGSFYRPGALALSGPFAASGRNHDLFYGTDLGVYGTFDTNALPTLEVLTAAVDSSFEGYLRVVRVGD